ncbi:MAG: hypothetical protein K8S56_04285 [Candidatus Cloacimonetes bacterium]|nr:hypothetical protein [Candidatus Cloacimonadota bacterium]
MSYRLTLFILCLCMILSGCARSYQSRIKGTWITDIGAYSQIDSVLSLQANKKPPIAWPVIGTVTFEDNNGYIITLNDTLSFNWSFTEEAGERILLIETPSAEDKLLFSFSLDGKMTWQRFSERKWLRDNIKYKQIWERE